MQYQISHRIPWISVICARIFHVVYKNYAMYECITLLRKSSRMRKWTRWSVRLMLMVFFSALISLKWGFDDENMMRYHWFVHVCSCLFWFVCNMLIRFVAGFPAFHEPPAGTGDCIFAWSCDIVWFDTMWFCSCIWTYLNTWIHSDIVFDRFLNYCS